MRTIKLKDICSLICKGYEADNTNLEDKLDKGIRINKVNYSNITDAIKKNTNTNQKVILKEKELLNKYKPEYRDLILPSTASNSVNTKILLDDKNSTIYDSIYSSNIVVVRLNNENSNLAVAMYYLFNLETMKEKLLENVYSQGKIKAISLNKLRDFEVPIVTNEITEAIEKMVNSKKELENLINGIMS